MCNHSDASQEENDKDNGEIPYYDRENDGAQEHNENRSLFYSNMKRLAGVIR